jgi:hypothetical protein
MSVCVEMVCEVKKTFFFSKTAFSQPTQDGCEGSEE